MSKYYIIIYGGKQGDYLSPYIIFNVSNVKMFDVGKHNKFTLILKVQKY